MANCHSLVDNSTSIHSKKPCLIDWKLCTFCQNDTKEGFECSAGNLKSPIGSGYKSLAEHLVQFQMHDYMPLDIDIKRLHDRDGIEATMMRHSASWHKVCQVKFSQSKLERLEKKLSEKVKSVPMQTRSSKESVIDEDRCFFCDETAGSACLHSASTYDIEQKVRKLLLSYYIR